MSSKFKVGLLVESSREFGRGVLRGIAAFARTAGNWSIYHQEQLLAADTPTWLRRWSVDGVLARVDCEALGRRLTRKRLPAVDLMGRYALPSVPAVESDDRAVVRMAVEHLRDRGFRHLAFCGFAGAAYSQRRQRFFIEMLAAHAATGHVFEERPSPGASAMTTTQIESAGLADDRHLTAWLRGLPKPIGIVACNDLRGLHVLNVCRQRGIAVPDDVAVIGVDNDEVLCELASPRLTSVEQDTEQIGYRASALLQRLMERQREIALPQPVAPLRIIARASTDVYALDDRVVAAAMRFIRQHASDGIDVADVVRHVRTSRTSLERRMHEHLGRTPLAEINRVRLERVKQLLAETDFTLPEVARLSGFAYSEYMIAFFRRHTNQTPGAYRRLLRDRTAT